MAEVKRLTDKTVVVLGACGLLGEEFSKSLSHAGASLIAVDVNENRLTSMIEELEHQYPALKISRHSLDVTTEKGVLQLVEVLSDREIDVVVNAIYPKSENYGASFENLKHKDFCEMLNLHLGSAFLLARGFSDLFKKQGHGHLIQIASIYGVAAPRFEIYQGTDMTMPFEYAAIKSSIIHMTKYLAKYFSGSGMRFNCISPGGIADGQPEKFMKAYQKFGARSRMLKPSDINGLLLFLISDESKAINGQNLIVDDGWSL